MSEPTAGSAFFGVETNFKAAAEEFGALERAVAASLGSIRNSFSQFGNASVDPLGKITEKVDQQAGLLQRRLAAAARDYQEQLRKGFTPPQSFGAKANELVSSGVGQINKAISGQASKLGDADLAGLRRTILTAFAEGGAAAARELQSQLRTAAKGVGVDAASVAGSSNTLRAGNITNPFLKDVPDSQSAADFVAATKRATQAREAEAKASQAAATADDQAAKASTAKAAQTKTSGGGGSGGNQPPPPPAAPPPPPPPPPPPAAPPPPPRDNPASDDAILRGLAERLKQGAARFINSGNAVFDPTGPTAATGEDIVSATSGRPLPAPVADRIRKVVQADIKAIEDQITQGALIALNPRVATQPSNVPDGQRTFLDRRTGTTVDNTELLNKSTQDLTELRRKEAAQSEAARVADAEREYARELLALAEDVRAKRRLGVPLANTGVRFGEGGTVLDERRGGTPSVLRLSNGGGVQQLNPQTDVLAANALRRDAENALRDQITASRELARTQRDMAAKASRSGLGNNFLHGLTSGGFGSGGEDGLDGLARAAGQTAKYSTLNQTLNLIRSALSQTVEGFLNANDSITEYQVATGRADAVNAQFLTGLQNVAEVSGFNVGEALDVASKAVRAFGDDTDRTQQSLDRLAQGFTTQASQLATLAKTNLTDAAGNLTAVASGFDLPKNGAGFSQVTDAIAGAKLAGGGDETQIFQGLANAAVTFKNLGFSLNESATVLSKINAQTDEGGQLIATRLSRLSSVLNGQAAGKFIQSLNQQLGPDQQVDQAASQRDQLVQLGRAYQSLGDAQRGALVSALGGTAEERELSVLLQNITQIADEANKIQPGSGLKEFQARLTNVRAQFKEIQGFVQTIIVNLTTSGLAAPVVELVGALKSALGVLSDISKFLKIVDDATSHTFGGFNVGITTVISNLGALLVAVKALQALRNNGGLRGVLAGAEQIASPTRALARQQLAGTLPGAPGTPGGGPGVPLAGVQGRAAAAATRAQSAIDLPSGVAADADVRDAGQRVKQAAEQLARAEEDQAAVLARQTEERRTLRARPGTNGDPVRDLNRRHEQELAGATQAGVSAQLDLAAAQAELARALRIQAAQAEVAAQFDARRAALTSSFERQIGRAQGQGRRAFAAGDTAGLQAANDREIALRQEFNAKLSAVEAERLVAEQRGAAVAGSSGLARGLDAASLGGVGAASVARQEGAGALGVARAFSSTAISGIGRGITSLFKFLGPVGIGLTVADFALQVKGASDEISRARSDLRDVNAQFKSNPLTPSSLRDFASSEGSAANQLQQASSGFTGGIADAFTGGAGAREAASAKRFSDALNRAAGALADQETRIRSARNPQQAAASTLDVSSPDSLKSSFDQLQNAGFNASESMQLLIERIKQLRFTAGSAHLTEDEQAKLSQAAGAQSSNSIGELTPTQFRTAGGGRGGAVRVPISPASQLDAAKVQARVAALVQGQLQGGADLGSTAGREQLEAVLIRGYSDLVPDKAQAAQLAQKIGQFVFDRASQFATTVNSVADLQNVVAVGLQAADADAQRSQTQAQLKSLQNGTRDTSAVAGASTRLNDLLQVRSVARQKIAELNHAGNDEGAGAARQQADRDLQALNDKIAEAQVQQAQALIAQAQQHLQDSTLIRRTEQRKARTSAQIKAIGQRFFQSDIKAALASKDIDTIRSVFDLASKTEVNAILRELDNVAAAKAAAARAAAARAKAEAALLAQVNTSGRDVAGGAAEQVLGAGSKEASAAARSAAREAADAKARAQAAHKAARLAYPENVYDTGSDRFGGSDKPKDTGPTQAQIAAAFAQAKAVRDRNSTEGLRAAVQAARADYAAAKDQQAKAQALQQLYQAQNALVDGLRAITVARRFVNAFPASAVQSAARSVADARLELRKYARGTLEYYQSLGSLVQAQRQLAEANQASYFLKQKLGTDLTDPAAQARIAVRQAAAKLALLRKQGAPADLQRQARLDLRDAQNSSESAAFSQRLSDAQTNEQLGRISHEAYIRYLTNEHNRLTAIRKRTRQQQDELNQVDLAMKSATQELQGQFNLGDVKVPTPYEVRRYIATQAKAATAGATASAAAGVSAGASGSSGVSIVVNGADIAFVRRVLAEYLGPSTMSTRAVSANRKG